MIRTQCDELDLNPKDVNFVIYHGNCSDGFASALAVNQYFKKTMGSDSHVEYFAAKFNQPPPDVSGKNVLICDFSYKFPMTKKILDTAKSLLIIDHHKSAEIELAEVSDKNKIFDMKHSGAYLTWKYFFPTEDVPLLIKYVEDNDIWIKAMPNTREVTSYVFSLPFEFQEYEKLLDPNELTRIIPIAQGMQKQNEYYIEKAVPYAKMKFVKIENKYYFVAHINSTVLKSEIGNRALSKYPNCDFSAIYSTDGKATYFSLRSDDLRTDVSLIATKYSGGGHRNAAGLSVYGTLELPGQLLDDDIMYGLLNNVHYKKCNINQQKEDNVVFLNATHNRKHIGKYLLQERTKEKKYGDRVLQQWCNIVRTNTRNPDFYDYSDLACVWNYDGQNNKVWVSLTWADSFDDEHKLSLSEQYSLCADFKCVNSENRVTFSVAGLSEFMSMFGLC